MDFLVFEQLLKVLESLAALARETLVLLTAYFVFHDVRELFLEDIFDSGLFLGEAQLGIELDLPLEIGRLVFVRRSLALLLSYSLRRQQSSTHVRELCSEQG